MKLYLAALLVAILVGLGFGFAGRAHAAAVATAPPVLIAGGYLSTSGCVQVYGTGSMAAVISRDGYYLASPAVATVDTDGKGVSIEGDAYFNLQRPAAFHVVEHGFRDANGAQKLSVTVTRKSDGAVVTGCDSVPLFTLSF